MSLVVPLAPDSVRVLEVRCGGGGGGCSLEARGQVTGSALTGCQCPNWVGGGLSFMASAKCWLSRKEGGGPQEAEAALSAVFTLSFSGHMTTSSTAPLSLEPGSSLAYLHPGLCGCRGN